ncbi:MAG: D-alanyl-D-alanine carboxypeptidase family protein [Acidimicrobiales bacterium]
MTALLGASFLLPAAALASAPPTTQANRLRSSSPGPALGSNSAPPQATAPPPTAPPARAPIPEAKSYVLVDVNTGNVLAGYNERLRLPPASLTKVLTALIAVTYLPPGATVTATKTSEAVYPNRVGMEVGKPWPLEEVLHALLIMSANDAAYAIAERISGDLSAFGEVMDRAAAQIGMSDHPVFHDPAGLDGSEGVDGGNLVSARDLAIAGRDLLSVPELARIVDKDSYYFVDPDGEGHWLASTNNAFLVSYPGAIGIKTGFTDAAGTCVMAAARRDGRTMMAVVMNGYNPTQSAIDLLDQGFATPAGSEPTSDRLPPVALPHPPSPPRSAARRSNKRALGGTPTQNSRSKGFSPSRHHQVAQGGFRQVVTSWPGALLLLASALGGAYALVEGSRVRALHRRVPVPSPHR